MWSQVLSGCPLMRFVLIVHHTECVVVVNLMEVMLYVVTTGVVFSDSSIHQVSYQLCGRCV